MTDDMKSAIEKENIEMKDLNLLTEESVPDDADSVMLFSPQNDLSEEEADKLITYMENGGKGVFFSTHITSDLDKIADMLIMIDNGRIVFREEKDTLLDTYRIAKGDSGALTTDTRKLFLSISETDFGFTGITKQISEVRSYIPNIMVERPTIEDIMLGNIGGEK